MAQGEYNKCVREEKQGAAGGSLPHFASGMPRYQAVGRKARRCLGWDDSEEEAPSDW
jgi:hypothetical protein